MTNDTSSAQQKRMVEDRLNNIVSDLNISQSEAFMRLAYALLFDTQYDSPDYATDVVDGGGDKQIDIIRIEETQDQAVIHLVQVKNSETYSGTVVVQMRDGLSWIFERPEDQYIQLANKDFVSKIREIREIAGRIGSRNLTVNVHYVAKGDTTRCSPDFKQEIQNTTNEYGDSNEFNGFIVKVWGVKELIDRFYENRQEGQRIDIDLELYYLWTMPTYLQYNAGSIKAVICTVNASEIARIVNHYGLRLFEENVRTYLGTKKSVNKAILDTCSNSTESQYFWFFNNGITITCDDFDPVPMANPAILKIKKMQIVNGCQTSMTLKEALTNGTLNPQTRVLLKVFATQDEQFVDKITRTTNSQTAVSSRDLSSNDQLQRYLEDLIHARGYYYERKPSQFKNLERSERKKIISNEKVGQSHLAVVEHLPATAMAHSNKIWSEAYYQQIFASRVEELLASYLIYIYCLNKSKVSAITLDGLDQTILKYSNFHFARLIGSFQLGEDWRHSPTKDLEEFIRKVEQNPDLLEADYQQAKTIIKQMVEEISEGDNTKIINVLKSDKIQQRLDQFMGKVP